MKLILILFLIGAIGQIGYSMPTFNIDSFNNVDDNFLQSMMNSMDYLNKINKTIRSNKICFDKIGCFYRDGIMHHIPFFPDSPKDIKTRFHIFMANDIKHEIVMDPLDVNSNKFSGFDPNKRVAIIVHGYDNSYSNSITYDLKNSFYRYMVNDIGAVILVDWEHGAKGPLYWQACVNAQVVGRQIAYFVHENKINPKLVHLIGYSLGAQVSGFAGKYSQEVYQSKYGRITGLDAAAPLFEGHEGSYLTFKDAHYVDAIHTSIGGHLLNKQLGFTKPYAHIDFYPNGGSEQPGCENGKFTCDHASSVRFFNASIGNHCQFNGYNCHNYADYLESKCTKPDSLMGYYSDTKSQAKGTRYLATTDHYPYCKNKLSI